MVYQVYKQTQII